MHLVVQELGRFESWEDVLACRLDEVVSGWLCLGGRREGLSEPPSSRKRAVQTPDAVWGAIRTVLLLMQVGAGRGASGGRGGRYHQDCVTADAGWCWYARFFGFRV